MTIDGAIISGRRGRILGSFFHPDIPKEGKRQPVVLLCHGFPGNDQLLDFAYYLQENGFHVMTFEYSGSWGSDGDYSLSGVIEDTETVLDWILKLPDERIDKTRIYFLCHSLGGFAGVNVFSRRSEPRAAVFISPANITDIYYEAKKDPDLLAAFMTEMDEFCLPLCGVNGRKLAAEIEEKGESFRFENVAAGTGRRPVLLVRGLRDNITPARICTDVIKNILDSIPGSRCCVVTFNSPHDYLNVRGQLRGKVLDFFLQKADSLPEDLPDRLKSGISAERQIPLKVVTAIDSFKGSLTSIEAGQAAAEGFHRVKSDIEVNVRPLADGGEGTVEALTAGMNGTLEHVMVTGPLGAPVNSAYGIIHDSMTAVIEMSSAAGITLVPKSELNPLDATTYGVGEIIRDAISKGCRRFIIGIGGSATNDGGAGMLQALGWGLLDDRGRQIPYGAKGLKVLDHISDEHVLPELSSCTFRIACDVTNPLCGPEGCSAVFGPQKGATPQMVVEMDKWLSSYANIAKKKYKNADPCAPGTGAAGGLGFAFMTFLGGALESGIKIVQEETHLEDFIKNADLVITGEGRLDFQTSMGKAPIGVAALAQKHGKPVIAFAGGVTKDASACNKKGIDAFFPIVRGATTLDAAMNPENARRNMADAAEQAMRLFLIRR